MDLIHPLMGTQSSLAITHNTFYWKHKRVVKIVMFKGQTPAQPTPARGIYAAFTGLANHSLKRHECRTFTSEDIEQYHKDKAESRSIRRQHHYLLPTSRAQLNLRRFMGELRKPLANSAI